MNQQITNECKILKPADPKKIAAYRKEQARIKAGFFNEKKKTGWSKFPVTERSTWRVE